MAKQQNNPAPNTAINTFWQWLTYGFWMLSGGLIVFLISTFVAFKIDRFTMSSYENVQGIPYVLPLVILSCCATFFIDKQYAKQEPENKHGFSGVLMVLHAVLAVVIITVMLFSSISLIGNLLSGSGASRAENIINILTILIALPVAIAVLFRIVKPSIYKSFRTRLRWSLVTLTGLAIVLSLIGPFQFSQSIKPDQLLDDTLSSVDMAINGYEYNHNDLPPNLAAIQDDLILQEQVNTVKGKKISYRAIEHSKSADGNKYRYELCVTYNQARGTGKNRADYPSGNLIVSDHSSGRVCYTLHS